MNEKEAYFIKKFDTLTNNEKGYNVANGGGNTNVFAGKTEDEMREIGKKISETRKGENNPRCRTVICLNTGEVFNYVKQAVEKYGVGCQTIVACCRGKLKSAGVIDGKPAVWMYYEDYQKLSEEEVNKIKNQELPNGGRSKAVICLNTGVIYESTREAERETGINHGSISACCRGKQKFVKDPITGEKLIFMFLDEYLKSLK
jgi:hypothetical protein